MRREKCKACLGTGEASSTAQPGYERVCRSCKGTGKEGGPIFWLVRDFDRQLTLTPGDGLAAWAAADWRLRDLGFDGEADAMKQELQDATKRIVEKYVRIRGTGALPADVVEYAKKRDRIEKLISAHRWAGDRRDGDYCDQIERELYELTGDPRWAPCEDDEDE